MRPPGPNDVRRYALRATWCHAHKKRGYKTRRKALRVAQQSESLTGSQLAVYRCPDCSLFHFTSQVQRTKELRRRKKAVA